MFEKIQAYLASQLDIPADEITRDTTFESLGVDSLDTVEMVMDLEEQLGVDLCNRLDAACDVHLYTVVLVQALQKVEHHPPARVVLVHSDFLPDDALLLLHCFLGEIRMGHTIQQNLQ